jgi:hypothetical protein
MRVSQFQRLKMREEQRDALFGPPPPLGAEGLREAALQQAHAALRSITHGHELKKTCKCVACEARRTTERALETYR